MQVHGRRLGAADGLPALLAHCFLGNGGSWKAFVDALPHPLDAQAPDMPGHGRAPMPEVPGDFHAAVAAALGALVAEPSLLIGHSFGAASLLRHALHNPDDVTGLVLIEPVFFAVAEGQPEFAPYRETEAPLHAAARGARLDDAARAFLALNPGSPDFDSLPAPVQALMAAQMRLVTATEAGLFGDSGGLLEPGLMEGFDKPVLLLLGSGTTPIFRATVRELTRKLPRAEAQVVEGAGHMVPISHPKETARIVGDWMTRNGLARSTVNAAGE